jgi:hypothetical protein
MYFSGAIYLVIFLRLFCSLLGGDNLAEIGRKEYLTSRERERAVKMREAGFKPVSKEERERRAKLIIKGEFFDDYGP